MPASLRVTFVIVSSPLFCTKCGILICLLDFFVIVTACPPLVHVYVTSGGLANTVKLTTPDPYSSKVNLGGMVSGNSGLTVQINKAF